MTASAQTTTDGRATTRRRRRVPALLVTSALIGSAITFAVASPAAYAADSKATIALSGITSNTYPVGGNTVWVQPGTPLTITQAPISVSANQGLLGTVSNLLGSLVSALNPVVGLKASVDLSSVQRGNQVLAGNQSVTTPALAKGVYPISWSFTAVTALGQNLALNGNQLNPLGIKLNAKNQYVGYIVSDTTSPCAGAQCIALQTPTLSVAPSLPVVGQLPTVTVPGQNVNIPVPSVPGVNAPLPGSTGTGTGTGTPAPGTTAPTAPAAGSTTTTTNPYGYTAPTCSGPCAVVPRGGGSGGAVGTAYGVTLGDLDAIDPAAASSAAGGTGAGSSDGDAAAAGVNQLGGGSSGLAVDRAFGAADTGGDTTATLSTSLTLAAIAALAGAGVLWFARRRLARG